MLYVRAGDEIEEADYITRLLREAGTGRGGDRTSAVLYRTNAQSRAIEDALMREGVPYRIIGGVRFYERKEIKDALAYLRLLINPHDDVSFRRVVNVPARGIGKSVLEALESIDVTVDDHADTPLLAAGLDPTPARTVPVGQAGRRGRSARAPAACAHAAQSVSRPHRLARRGRGQRERFHRRSAACSIDPGTSRTCATNGARRPRRGLKT